EFRTVISRLTARDPMSQPCPNFQELGGGTTHHVVAVGRSALGRLPSRDLCGQYSSGRRYRDRASPRFENPTSGASSSPGQFKDPTSPLLPNYARCMAQKWRVKVTTGAPDEAKAQDIVRRLPDDSRPT